VSFRLERMPRLDAAGRARRRGGPLHGSSRSGPAPTKHGTVATQGPAGHDSTVSREFAEGDTPANRRCGMAAGLDFATFDADDVDDAMALLRMKRHMPQSVKGDTVRLLVPRA